jgi:uncharacterized protein YecE (DUF72 family)
MSLLPLFDAPEELPPQASRLASKLRRLAEKEIFFGTSSWKYEGWLGTIYSPERYKTRGKFSRKAFEAGCLEEYAQVFPVVCGDFAFYQFPTAEYWERLFGTTPDGFQFGFKVPEDITVARWPTHARYGTRAGKANEAFLDAEVFKMLFARRLEPYRARVATLIFEFGAFSKAEFPTPADFFARLDTFLEALPGGFRLSVEIRNPEYLGADYFALLARHGVAHVFNAWTRMPELDTQREMPGAFSADFTVVRALLRKGRGYGQAVDAFQPYQHVQEPNPAARDAMQAIALEARRRKSPAFLFVNNRLEGHAPTTIEDVADRLEASDA